MRKGINDIDYTGLSMLQTLAGELAKKDTLLCLANLKGRVVENIEDFSGLRDAIGSSSQLCLDMSDALNLIDSGVAPRKDERDADNRLLCTG